MYGIRIHLRFSNTEKSFKSLRVLTPWQVEYSGYFVYLKAYMILLAYSTRLTIVTPIAETALESQEVGEGPGQPISLRYRVESRVGQQTSIILQPLRRGKVSV